MDARQRHNDERDWRLKGGKAERETERVRESERSDTVI